MRSISFSAIARTLAAVLLLGAFAIGAHAYAARVGSPHPAPAPTRSFGHGGGPPRVGGASGACGGGLVLEAPSPDSAAGDAVQALSSATQDYIKTCQCDTPQCIADALDQYAQALAVVAPRLSPRLRNIPSVVATAARRVRAAKTTAEAVKALHEAIAVIHKDVSLVRAEDPQTLQRETRSGDFVADTLNVASLSLEKAGGL